MLARVVSSPAATDAFARLHGLTGGEVAPALGVEALWPGVPLNTLKAALKPSKADLARVEAMREASARLTTEPGAPLLRALYRHGREAVLDACLLLVARGQDEAFLRRHAEAAGLSVPAFPVQGRDLIARGLTPGPGLGAALKEAEAAWLAAGLPTDEATLERLVADAVG